MTVTITLRSLCAFAAGLVVAVIALVVFQAVTAEAVSEGESTFVPVTPCRLFDTRPGGSNIGTKNSPIGADDSHAFQVTGSNGDCTIPAAATAVSINLTGVTPTAQTNLRMYPADEAVPNAAVLNMSAGQPPLPNKLDVKLSPGGAVAIYNRFGSIHVIGDVLGYYRADGLTDLDARIADLEAEVAALQIKTAPMSVLTVGTHPTVRFSGVNVQVVDGSDSTACSDTTTPCTGVGNLIVGYNEDSAAPEARGGSHNIVVGTNNDWASHSGLVVGHSNTISGLGATVTGGEGNTASGARSSVSGGLFGSARGTGASVSGGGDNVASGLQSSVSGGRNNTASGSDASVSGGDGNVASGDGASVSGGATNVAGGTDSSVSGGVGNRADGDQSAVAGGDGNTAGGLLSFVGGGLGNQASGPRAVVSGGADNVASGSKSVVGGGSERTSAGVFDWRAGTLFEDQ